MSAKQLRLSTPNAEDLRKRVLRELQRAGFRRRQGRLLPGEETKDQVRALHASKRKELLRSHWRFIEMWESTLMQWFADGEEVDPKNISPHIVPVENDHQAALFKFASLHWSVPVSQGYGRRTRFLLMDRTNRKLIGLFALGDPVYNLRPRDQLIGWNVEQRNARLYNILDAFVLGAMPPYRELIGGKLVAMAALSDETVYYIRHKYTGRQSHILGKVREARPVLITTTSALGRSSVYNRVKFGDQLLFKSVGFTEGYGHFQFSDSLFKSLCDFLEAIDGLPGHRFGQGPNWKIRTLRSGLEKIGLDPELLKHGIRRQVFVAPTAANWLEYLRGETASPQWFHFGLDQLADFFINRWAVPRSERDHSYLSVSREAMRLSSEIHQLDRT